jgi:hypothetical protein
MNFWFHFEKVLGIWRKWNEHLSKVLITTQDSDGFRGDESARVSGKEVTGSSFELLSSVTKKRARHLHVFLDHFRTDSCRRRMRRIGAGIGH